ncbi:hypothetical protein B0O99DRAFT_631536 [Bisporella sp. PMI_857]|nr:hypothetical protein B0O99DRAFT_631536 [Bisporella sp. PMI_857]
MEEAFYAKLALRLKLEQEGMIEPRGWVHPDDSDISDYDEHDSLPKNDNHRQAMKEAAAATSGIQNRQPILGSFVRDASETQTETGSISGCTITMFEDRRALTQADDGEKEHGSTVHMDGGVGSELTHQAKFGILNYRTPEPSPSLPFASTDLIRVYQVVKIDSEQDIVNKADQVTKNIAREFTDYVLANNHAEKSFATHRGKNPSRISSSDTYKAGLFYGIIQKTHTRTTEITIEVDIKLVSKTSKFSATTMSRRYPAKYYMIRTIHLSQVTEKDGTVVKERKSDLLGKGFTVREMANHDAAEYIIKYIKPLGANIDHVREHAESIKAIRAARDKCNEAKACINIELEFGGQVPWLAGKGEISLTVVVEEKEWEGPLN